MQPLYIRPMTEKDIPAAAMVLSEAFNSSALHTERQLADIPAKKGRLIQAFVAARGHDIIGVSVCERHPSSLTIELLAVDERHRAKGVGASLMRHTEKFMQRHWLDGKAADVLIEDSTKRQNNMSRYYENMGYQEWWGMSENGLPLLYKTLKPLPPAGTGNQRPQP